jgi:hypothetical protein
MSPAYSRGKGISARNKRGNRHGAMAAADICYANKKYFPRVLAILYLPCTF